MNFSGVLALIVTIYVLERVARALFPIREFIAATRDQTVHVTGERVRNNLARWTRLFLSISIQTRTLLLLTFHCFSLHLVVAQLFQTFVRDKTELKVGWDSSLRSNFGYQGFETRFTVDIEMRMSLIQIRMFEKRENCGCFERRGRWSKFRWKREGRERERERTERERQGRDKQKSVVILFWLNAEELWIIKLPTTTMSKESTLRGYVKLPW